MTDKKNISIIGCGWLGLPLAESLIAKDYYVKGSTTTLEKLKTLQDKGISPYLINLSDSKPKNDLDDFLNGTDTLIINIPPGLRKHPDKNHIAEIKSLIKPIENSRISNVIYISSTSVYQDTAEIPIITENTIPNGQSNSAKQLIAIEDVLLSNTKFKTTVLRFSGLFDENRHPGNFLSGKKNIKNGDAPVNLIHKNDCISIIELLINKVLDNMSLNASYPHHPSKKSYYTTYCKTKGLALPEFDNTTESKGKVVDSSKLVQLLGYTFQTGL